MSSCDGGKDLVDSLLFNVQRLLDQLQLFTQLIALTLHAELFASYELSGLDELVNGVELFEKSMASKMKVLIKSLNIKMQ